MAKTCFITSILCLFFLIQPAVSQDNYQPEREVFKELVNVAGVSTHEEAILQKIIEFLPENVAHSVDDKNNLLVTIGSGETELLFIAHMDEIGLEVDKINEDGTLSTIKRGGSYDSIWESKVVKIHTGNGVVDGIIPPRASYLDNNPETFKRSDLKIYVGTSSKSETEKLGIKKGDSVVQVKRSMALGEYKMAAGSIDDRAGSTAQILALKALAGKSLDKKVTFVWCVEEEIGLFGARYVAQSHHPDFVFAVDTFVSSDAPRDSKTFAYTKLGEGAVIRAFDSSNLAPRELYNRVYNLAHERNIPVQIGITNGGNDGSAFLAGGSQDLPLSWPGLYSHSYVSVIDLRDLHSLTNLIIAIAESF